MPATMRPYIGAPADLRAMGDLLLACRAAGPIDHYPSLTQVRALLRPATAAAVLWEDAGRPVGFALLEPRSVLLLYTDPTYSPADSEETAGEMVAWAAAGAGASGQGQLSSPAREDDVRRIDLLGRLGFVPHHWVTLRMVRRLDALLPEPRFPAGFGVRPVAGEGEVEAHVALHRDAFDSENPTAAYRLGVMRDPEYRPDLDLVATAPDGSLVGFCLCVVGREENARLGRRVGWVDALGIRPDYRGLGLGRALLLAGLQRLKAHGVDTVVLGTAHGNGNAIRLYESVDFTVAYRVLWYARSV